MLEHGAYIWVSGRDGLAQGLTPELLAAAHPLWAYDVRAMGPWKPAEGPALDGRSLDLLRGRGGEAGHRGHAPALVCGATPSAMDAAFALDAAGALPDWGAVLAVSQTAGRGQLRRPWASPPGNLYAAWLWPSLEKPWDGLAPLLAGYAACRALRRRLPGLMVKWPNDLLLDDLKMGGILVEERRGRIIVGLGLNLVSAPASEDLRAGHAVAAGFMNTLCSGFGPLHLWLTLAAEARKALHAALAGAPADFLASMEPLLAWRGREVRVADGDRVTEGVLAGLAQDGGLRIFGEDGETVLYSGGIHPLY